MTRVVVVAHQPLASALLEVAQHVYPACASQLVCVDIGPELSLEEATAKVMRSAAAVHPTVMDTPPVVLVDVLGATPARAARQAFPDAPLAAGVNVPMLWRSLCYGSESAEALLGLALDGGTRGVAAVPPDP